MSFIYIASPYTHPDADVRHARYLAVQHYTTKLLKMQRWCYSPIVHCHDLAIRGDLPKDYSFWKEYNTAMLRVASSLHVYTMEGWNSSKGIDFEIALAHHLNIPISYIPTEDA